MLAPVIDLKSKSRDIERDEEQVTSSPLVSGGGNNIGIASEFDWNVVNEYDPMWPNEYEKVVKELRDLRDREHDQESELRKRRRESSRFEDIQVWNFLLIIYYVGQSTRNVITRIKEHKNNKESIMIEH